MRRNQLQVAIEEAERFLQRARALQRQYDTANRDSLVCGTAASGAVRRSSMDLTRALAALRKP